MESVINFLADYYIWFFVAAGVLCFALVGFIIESKKKDKNTFKGESLSETDMVNSNNMVNNPVNNPEPVSEIFNTTVQSEPIVQSEPTPVVNEPQELPKEEVVEDTMEINDIPLKEEDKTPIEFYSEPVINNEPQPINEQPAVEMINETTPNTTNSTNENIETLNIFEDIK